MVITPARKSDPSPAGQTLLRVNDRMGCKSVLVDARCCAQSPQKESEKDINRRCLGYIQVTISFFCPFWVSVPFKTASYSLISLINISYLDSHSSSDVGLETRTPQILLNNVDFEAFGSL